ncbi:AlbA family DNA-binding domain-containing protein [Sphingobium fuliginis]|uniref:Schlafen AlbA-2 domain-containing protein n=1 Tax=Sphingobium fuliginis (strain ATCC 27551) TaxID=336203 RepID=A0ABQ1EZ49_SPHSA|nr:ATP-binding protein [Sphingobium fuliginis]RYL97621.1 ATP-binding protein [Sphingobium fuliginis]GFZ94183.1 hypothetical protein GCM10019071_25580 [Sphingobium fuliginis]
MAKRSITNEEIALIKAMRNRGMRNSAIQFYFNRPDRQVNSGRITNIADGSYSDSAAISAADDATLDTFLGGFQQVSATMSAVPTAAPSPPRGPLDPVTITALFAQDADGTWRFSPGETDEHECKASFRLRNPHVWLRAIAALANNRGGYILFGVHDKDTAQTDGVDKSFAVLGLTGTEFANLDPADLTSHVKAKLDPTPRVRSTVIDFGGKAVGILHVEQHPSRPVIVTKQEGDIREGDIFFRYPGQSSRIKYGDLRTMLDERDAMARQQILPMVEKLLQRGPDRILLADLDEGVLDDGKRPITIDKTLLDQLSFVREGEFSEVEGAPTLRLIGEVRATGDDRIGSRGVVTEVNLLKNFLKQETLFRPVEYIRFAVEASHAEWLPIFYFAQQSQFDRADLAAFIDRLGGTAKRREMFTKRATGAKMALTVPVGTPAALLMQIVAGDLPEPTNGKDATNVALAMCGLTSLPDIERVTILAMLERCYDLAQVEAKSGVISTIRRAACRIDELLFAPPS